MSAQFEDPLPLGMLPWPTISEPHISVLWWTKMLRFNCLTFVVLRSRELMSPAHNHNVEERPSQHCKQLLCVAFYNLFEMDFQNNPVRWSELFWLFLIRTWRRRAQGGEWLSQVCYKTKWQRWDPLPDFWDQRSCCSWWTLGTSTVYAPACAQTPTRVRIRRLRHDGK